MHGHEYSNRPSSPQSSHKLRPPLLFSALSPPKNRATTTTDAPVPKKPVLRQRPASEYIPRNRTPEPLVRFLEPDVVEPQTPAMNYEDQHVFSDSEVSEVAVSVDGHSDSGRRTRRRRTTSRKSTNYYLGYPTPKKLGNLKVMHTVLPRLLLQLKAVSPDGHARPMLEVFPSSRIAGLVITPRLAKRFPGIFGVKRQLGYDDLVLMKRDDEELDREDSESGDSEDAFEKSKLLAVYSPVKHSEETEIVLGDGSIWTAKALPNGCYDFVHVDECGHVTTARWARRSAGKTPPTSPAADTLAPPPGYPRFTFSIINPLSRRHPVMATLTHSSLNVQDTYTTVSSSYGRFPPRPIGRAVSVNMPSRSASSSSPSSPLNSSPEDSEADSAIGITQPEPESERTVRVVDEATKSLISITALWVVLRSGWSPNYIPSTHNHTSTHSDEKSPTSPTTGNERPRRRHTWSRPVPSDSLCSSKASTPPMSRQPSDTETPQIQQPTTPAQLAKPKRHSMPTQPVDKVVNERCASPAPSASNVRLPGPRRATSTGANFMRHRLLSEAQSDQDLGSPISEKVRHGLQGMCPLRNRSADPLVGGGLLHSQHHYFGHQRDDSMATTYCAPIQEIRPSLDVRPAAAVKVVEEGTKTREVPKLVVDTTFVAADKESKGEKEKKHGMRMMLRRWVHKLGSR